jgi:hypothetical protein
MSFIGPNPSLTYDALGNPINSVLAATGTNGLAVATVATNFIYSTNNSTTTQLAPNATYTGVIETALSQPAISLLMTADQNMVLTLKQFIDLAGTYAVAPMVFSIPAGQQFSRSIVLNGNYIQMTATNQGSATTTTFNLNTAYGTIDAVDSQGNKPTVTYITGQTTGDFDSVALLDNVVRGDLTLHTKSINNPTQDINGNLILSDAPKVGTFVGIVAQAITIDTQGYQTLQITTNSTFAATGGVQFSNDGVTFGANAPMMTASGSYSSGLAANINYSVPCVGRYARITPTTAGAITYFLRNSVAQIVGQNLVSIGNVAVTQATAQLGVNLVNIGGTANASQAGTLALGTTAATNGMTLGTLVAPLTVAATVVKATPGKLYSLSVGNAQATAVYLKVYNAASVTLGTTSPIQNYLVPASGTFNVDINDVGLYFSTGICIAVTGGQALLDSTALTTAAVVNYSFI